MDTNRANLDQLQSNTKYIFFTIILVILSILGVFLFYKIKTTDNSPPRETPPDVLPTIVQPTPDPGVNYTTPSPEEISQIPPHPTSAPPTEFPANVSEPTAIPTTPAVNTPAVIEPTSTPIGPTPAVQTYDGTEDSFTISYSSDRKIIKIKENTGYRITFYRTGSSNAVHVGSDWSWINPGRELKDSYKISGQPAFRYDIAAQTLVDVKYKDKFYTIQCIHNSDDNLKSECEQLITSFNFL
jgi:hypothetical protein